MAYAAFGFASDISTQALAASGGFMVDEIHTVEAVFDGRAVATFEARLNDDDTTDAMSDKLVNAVCGSSVPFDAFDVHTLAAAFDTAFERCEAIPGDGASGHSASGSVIVTVSRRIG